MPQNMYKQVSFCSKLLLSFTTVLQNWVIYNNTYLNNIMGGEGGGFERGIIGVGCNKVTEIYHQLACALSWM